MIEPRVARFYEALQVSPPFDENFFCTLEGIPFEGAVDRGSKGSLQGITIFCPLVVGTEIVPRLDMTLDHGPLREVPGRIVPVHDKHGWHWQAQVAGASTPVDIAVSASGAPAAGLSATFSLGDGAFGVPWIASTRPE